MKIRIKYTSIAGKKGTGNSLLSKSRCLAGHVLRRLDLSYMTHRPSPMPWKSRAYFEAISLLPRHVGAVLVNGQCIGYMLAENS